MRPSPVPTHLRGNVNASTLQHTVGVGRFHLSRKWDPAVKFFRLDGGREGEEREGGGGGRERGREGGGRGGGRKGGRGEGGREGGRE